MTTQRHNRRGDDDVSLHGSHVHLHTTITTADVTTLPNAVLRGEFTYPDKTPVRLKAGPRVALYALLTYHRDRADPAWRLDMDKFVGDCFVEKKTTVYGWIRTLEETGFVVRRRVNSTHTGTFEWHLDVADRPGILPGAPEKPQVTPSAQKGGDGAAPPVDNSETAGHTIPMKTHDGKNPSMVNPAHGLFLREITTKELPASPPSTSHARTTTGAVEGDGSRPEQPTLSLVRPTARTADEDRLAADADWQDWVLALLDHPAVRAAAPLRPTARDVELVAIRAQVAADQWEWTRKQLAERVLLVRLDGVQHLGSVWCARLHPQSLGAPPVAGRRTEVERGRPDRDAMPPSPERIAEIRQLHGAPRGARWRKLGGGS